MNYVTKEEITQETLERIEKTRKIISDAILEKFSDHIAGIECFGSSRSTLLTKNSDVDISLFTKDSDYIPGTFLSQTALDINAPIQYRRSVTLQKEDQSALSKEQIRQINMNEIANHLQTKRGIITVKQIITQARVPLIKVEVTIPGERQSLNCDITVNNTLGMYNSELLHMYCTIDPRVRQILLLVKSWAKARQIGSAASKTLSMYGWSLLALNFLQVAKPPVIPNLQSLEYILQTRGLGHEDRIVKEFSENLPVLFSIDKDPWIQYQQSSASNKNKLNVAELFADFFIQYMGNWNLLFNACSVRADPLILGRDVGTQVWREMKDEVMIELNRAKVMLLRDQTFDKLLEAAPLRMQQMREGEEQQEEKEELEQKEEVLYKEGEEEEITIKEKFKEQAADKKEDIDNDYYKDQEENGQIGGKDNAQGQVD
ncbi:MAG: putative terminal uridylyltransferase [Streblomastix strix]|uniref:Putative terminal uridylyltransferase n=1 Tax=Streblomastix strix TaxID=222440 RepID=A0A5J4WZX8_9EUKA|nr:MAG: putative terminal uridylyltransferase [Streblomastix strix]